MQQRLQTREFSPRHLGLRWMVVVLAIGMILTLAGSASTHAMTSAPAAEPAPVAAPWPPFVRIVPQGNGDDVTVYAEGIGHAYNRLSATFGGTSHTWSHTDMDYDAQDDLYRGVATAALSEPCPEASGCLRVATTGLGDPNMESVLAYEFVTAGVTAAPDLTLEMAQLRFGTPAFTDAVSHTVVLAAPPRAPAPLPGGWWILESGLYVVESDGIDGSLRAALTVRYDPDWLDWRGLRAEDLRLWRWDAADRIWVMLPSTVSTRLFQVSAPIDALTAYALAAPPKHRTWLPVVMRDGGH